MDRFLTAMVNKAVLSPTATQMGTTSHKRSSDIVVDDDTDRSSKKSKAASDNSSSLPHFPSHSLAWQPAAQTFYDALPTSHRSPFIDLVNDILSCNGLFSPSTSATSSPLATASPSPAPAPLFDVSSALLTFLDLSFVQPRGRFDVHVTDNGLVLTSTGKQQSTTLLPLTSLAQLAAVPDINRKDRCVLLSLRPTAAPLVVGKTTLHQLLLKIDTTRKASDPKALRLSQSTNQPANPLLADHFLATLRQHCPTLPVIAPQPDTFTSTAATPSISCYYGTNDGQLYPLSAGLLFIQRPVVWVPLETVDGIEVSRSGGGKCFDLKVGVKRSGEKEEVVVFSMISVMEQQALEWYVQYVAKWQKKREKEEKASASVTAHTADSGSTATTSTAQLEANGDQQGDKGDDSDSEADSDFDPDDSSDEEGGRGADRDNDSDSEGDDSDSDDSQFNSDIDVDAEVSAADIVKERKRRTQTVQPVKPNTNQPSRQQDSHDSEGSEDEQQTETVDGGEQTDDEESEQAVHHTEQSADESVDTMSRFRNVAAADTSKDELNSSGSSAEEDEVITIDD